MYKWEIQLAPTPHPLRVYICTAKELKEHLPRAKELNLKDDYSGVHLTVSDGKEIYDVIHMLKWDLETLVHELMHVIDELCEYTGIKDTEFRAYTMDYLFRECRRGYKVAKETEKALKG